MNDRGRGRRSYRRRQRCREDKSGSMGSHGVHNSAAARDVAAERSEGLRKRSLYDVDAPHYAVPFGDASAAHPVHANGMHLVEVGHRVIALREFAYPFEWRNIAIHRIDALEDDQLRAAGGCAREQLLQVLKIVVAPDLLGTAGGTH